MTSRAEARLLELEAAAQVATSKEDVALILAEEQAIRETLNATVIDEVAHLWIRLAANPDKVRKFLKAAETARSGFAVDLRNALKANWEG